MYNRCRSIVVSVFDGITSFKFITSYNAIISDQVKMRQARRSISDKDLTLLKFPYASAPGLEFTNAFFYRNLKYGIFSCRPYCHLLSNLIVLVLIKLTKFAIALRLRCGSCKLMFDIISSLFDKFKNVVHSLEPGETPSYSASHKAPNYVQYLKYRKIL